MQKLLIIFTLFIFFTKNNAQEITIPYDDSIGVPIIKVYVDGKIYNFGFDTGAYRTVINSTLFHNLPTTGYVDNIGGTGSERKKMNLTRLTFSILDKKYINHEVLHSDLSHFSIASCDSTFVLAGIIGRDIMVDYIVEINPLTKKISLYNHSIFNFKNLNDFTKIKLRNSSEPRIPIKIGTQNRYVLYDTGSNDNLNVSDYKLENYLNTTTHTKYQSKGTTHGVHGLVNDVDIHHLVYNGSIMVGKLTVTNQLFETSRNDENNMGYKFSQQFITYLDLKNNQIAMKQIGELQHSPLLINDLGFSVSYNKEQNKNSVTRLSLKNKVLKLGDTILSINGEEPPSDNCKMYSFLQKFIEKPISIVIEREGAIINLPQN